MTYWMLNAVFLVIVALVVVAAILTKRSPSWRAVGLSGVVLIIMTAIFDNVIIGVGLVDYDPDRFAGIRIGLAPLEDFAYTIAAMFLLPSLWRLLERRPRA
jgi:lycopene cyclase domain-containing protein